MVPAAQGSPQKGQVVLIRIAQHLADGAVFLDHRDAAGVVAVAGAGGADDFSVRHVLDPVGSAWLPGSPYSIAEVGSQTKGP